MRDLLSRLERWLEQNCPQVEDALGPGLMEYAIDLYEKDLGTKFPASLRALNHWRYGQLPDRKAPILGRYQHLKLNAGVPAMRDDVLPVFVDSDDFIGWHLPSREVIESRGGQRRIIAPDFDVYLTAYVESLEAGVWRYDAVRGIVDDGAFEASLAERFPPQPFVPPPKPKKPAPPPEKPAIKYSPSTQFAVGDRIEHPSFGIGTVRSVNATKAEVDFSSGARTLVHARGK
jgi:hypothetical protein